MVEGCIVESCLPEFKGTYDEDQDDMIAVDWEGNNEQVDFRLEAELNINSENQRGYVRDHSKYQERLSVLQIRFEDFLHEHAKNKRVSEPTK